jgi:hypothetical protein
MKPNSPETLMLESCGKLTDLVGLPQLLLRRRLFFSCVNPTESGWLAATAKCEQMGFHATGGYIGGSDGKPELGGTENT